LYTCLGDIFSVFWIRYVADGDGSNTLNQLFSSVFEDVASYAALHHHKELNQQYGDLSIANLTVKEFFYPDASAVDAPRKQTAEWIRPKSVFAAPRLQQDRIGRLYSDVSSQPTYHGLEHWWAMTNATQRFQSLLRDQQEAQRLHWNIVMFAHPLSLERQLAVWTHMRKPEAPACEIAVHNALVRSCSGKIDVTSSYALQFHQVIVNLCNDDELAWKTFPNLGVSAAELACTVSPGMTGAQLGMGPQVVGEGMMLA